MTHGQYAMATPTDWTGKMSRLSGANLETYQDFVVGLPRSVRDHLTNQSTFGPDGALYIAQGSNNAHGRAGPDLGAARPSTCWRARSCASTRGAVAPASPPGRVR